jgi:hypothetical protein
VNVLASALSVVWLAAVVTASPSASTALHAPPALRYADGAPPGFSGVFGENSCHACHFEAAVNTRPGHVTIDGVPDRFVPGALYPLTITLQRPGMKTGGFQLAARFKDNGAQAGALGVDPADSERVKIESKDDVQYANQRTSGSGLTSPDAVRWTVLWTAPARRGTVSLDVAANAGNKDEGASGDYVFTVVRESEPVGR